MDTKPSKPILNFNIQPELLTDIDRYWHRYQFSNRASAVKFLLAWALAQNPSPQPKGKKTK